MNQILSISEQIPESFRTEYPMFVTFLEKYYEYLTSGAGANQPQNYKTGSLDLDSSLDLFIADLKTEFAVNIPSFGKLGDREFLRVCKQFYAAKGSSDSYKFLIRAMFGKEVEIVYPNDSVFRSSDGIWQQSNTIRVQMSGPISYVGFDPFTISHGQSNFTLFAQRMDLNPFVTNLYEIRLTDPTNIGFVSGDKFSYGGVTGTVVTGAAGVSVVSGGTGFKLGQYFYLNGASPVIIKVGAINSVGGITKIDLIKAGAVRNSPSWVSLRPGYVTTIYESNTAFTSSDAVVKINIGAVVKYPGKYISSKGFLSDIIKIRNEYYQEFSYVMKLDEQLASYKTAIKQLLHPAGMALWAEFSIENSLSLSLAVQALAEFFELIIQDDVVTVETPPTFDINKPLVDASAVFDGTSFDFSMMVPILADTQVAGDYGTLAIEAAGDYAINYFLEVFPNQYALGSASTVRTW
jgi:hypothetical protein